MDSGTDLGFDTVESDDETGVGMGSDGRSRKNPPYPYLPLLSSSPEDKE